MKVKKLKKAKKPDFLILMMMQMRAEAEDRAHYQMEKADDQNQLVEMIVGITTGYFRTSGGRKKRKIQQQKKEQMTAIDLSSRSSDVNSSGSSDSEQEGYRGGNMGGVPNIITCTISPDSTHT